MKLNADLNTKKLVMAAAFAALICAATFAIKIPSPIGGYINMGDCFVLLGAWVLSRKLGVAAAAIGSGVADLISGALVFAPATFVIKGLMALTANLVFHALNKRMKKSLSVLISGALAEGVMVLGYFVFEIFIYGLKASLPVIPFNSVQGVVCLAAAAALYGTLGVKLTAGK